MPDISIYDAYRLREYQVAVNEVFARERFEGDMAEWNLLSWNERNQSFASPVHA